MTPPILSGWFELSAHTRLWDTLVGTEAREKLENELRERVLHIIQLINEKQNHIPINFQHTELIPFPYEVREKFACRDSDLLIRSPDHNTLNI